MIQWGWLSLVASARCTFREAPNTAVTQETWLARWKETARTLKREVHALYFAYRDSRTPWLAKLVAAMVVAYALSPLDLIPDPVPVLGYLDDLLLLPIGVWLALRLVPPAVMADARRAADRAHTQKGGIGWIAAGVIVLLYLAIGLWLWRVLWRTPR